MGSHNCWNPGVLLLPSKPTLSPTARRTVACVTMTPCRPSEAHASGRSLNRCLSVPIAISTVSCGWIGRTGRGKHSTYFCPWQPRSYVILRRNFAFAALVSQCWDAAAITSHLSITPNRRNLLMLSYIFIINWYFLPFYKALQSPHSMNSHEHIFHFLPFTNTWFFWRSLSCVQSQ